MTFSTCSETAASGRLAVTGDRVAIATLAAACLATAAIAMTITTSTVALAGVQAELRLGMTQLQWVLNSFIVSYATLLLPFGAWSDRVGQRPLFLWGAAVFVIGAGVAVLAGGMSLLIAGRSLQGVGAALLTATAPAALTAAFASEAHRKRAFGYLGSSGGVGLALGAVLAGTASDWGGWRMAYALPIPVALAGLLVCMTSREALTRRLAIGAKRTVTWLALLRNRPFVFSCVICLLFTTVWVALFIYAPLHMQTIDALDARTVGMLMLALLLPALVMPIVATRLVLVLRARAVLLTGFVVIALGLWLIDTAWSGTTSRLLEVLGLGLCGTGAGMLYGLVDYLGLTAVPPEQVGLASGAFNVVRLLGDILAAIIPGAVVLKVVTVDFARSQPNVSSDLLDAIAAGDVRAVDPLGLMTQARLAFASGMEWAIWALIALAVLGVGVALVKLETPR
jgi:predicted MFS family arabinose efflux permease